MTAIVTASPGLDPYCQGTFDSLCGLYAIINGIRLAIPLERLSKAQCRSLFKYGMECLEDNDCGDIVRNGLPSKNWHALARHMFDQLYERYDIDLKCGKRAFRKLPTDGAVAIEQVEDAVARGISVAVELQPTLNHYTVVRAIDDDAWHLFDSYGYKSIKRRSLGGRCSEARHRLGPRAIFFHPPVLSQHWQT